MTISYKKLRGLSKSVRGVVGFFIHSSYQVKNQVGNNAQLAIKGHQVAIEWSQMTKRISCWRIPKSELISLLGVNNFTASPR